jgi:hypothetical protein
MAYELSGEQVQPFVPGSFVTAEISNKRVISGSTAVSPAQVPEKIRHQVMTAK